MNPRLPRQIPTNLPVRTNPFITVQTQIPTSMIESSSMLLACLGVKAAKALASKALPETGDAVCDYVARKAISSFAKDAARQLLPNAYGKILGSNSAKQVVANHLLTL